MTSSKVDAKIVTLCVNFEFDEGCDEACIHVRFVCINLPFDFNEAQR